MRLSPTLSKLSMDTIIEDDIDFWYDSINMCVDCNSPIDIFLHYVDAINDEDTE